MTHLPPQAHFLAPIVDGAGNGEDEAEPAWERFADDGSGPEEVVELAEMGAAVERLKQELRPDEFKLLALHYGLGRPALSLRELADSLGVAHQAVHQRLERILRRAKGILERHDRHASTH